MNLKKLNQWRITSGAYGSDPDDKFGCFLIPTGLQKPVLTVVCSPMDDGTEWQHVSVSSKNWTPTWEIMCKIKDLFWDPEVVVVQYHPKKSDYVNNHPHCLHMFHWNKGDFPMPERARVGIKDQKDIESLKDLAKSVKTNRT